MRGLTVRLGLSRSEIGGPFADLALLIPLEAALIAVNGLNPTSTLLGVGILYIGAGWYFGLPMPVQPLKALAAIAIAQQLSPDVIAAGALRPGRVGAHDGHRCSPGAAGHRPNGEAADDPRIGGRPGGRSRRR